MKISELIQKLEEIKDTSGDILCTVNYLPCTEYVELIEQVKIEGADRTYEEGVFYLTQNSASKSIEVVHLKGMGPDLPVSKIKKE